MKTPITDAVFGPQLRGYRAETCRKLELDRAALMEALERATSGFHGSSTGYYHVDPKDIAFAKASLAEARANFPEP